MRGSRRRQVFRAIRTLRLHGRTVVEVVGRQNGTLAPKGQAYRAVCHSRTDWLVPGIPGLFVTHALIGWCLGKVDMVWLWSAPRKFILRILIPPSKQVKATF